MRKLQAALPPLPSRRKAAGSGGAFATSAEAMHRIRIENARHGGGQKPLSIEQVEVACPSKDDELLAMDDALERVALQHQEEAELVKLRYLFGSTEEKAGEILGTSLSWRAIELKAGLEGQTAP